MRMSRRDALGWFAGAAALTAAGSVRAQQGSRRDPPPEEANEPNAPQNPNYNPNPRQPNPNLPGPHYPQGRGLGAGQGGVPSWGQFIIQQRR